MGFQDKTDRCRLLAVVVVILGGLCFSITKVLPLGSIDVDIVIETPPPAEISPKERAEEVQRLSTYIPASLPVDPQLSVWTSPFTITNPHATSDPSAPLHRKTLVVYGLNAQAAPQPFLHNAMFFLRFGIFDTVDVDYIIVVKTTAQQKALDASRGRSSNNTVSGGLAAVAKLSNVQVIEVDVDDASTQQECTVCTAMRIAKLSDTATSAPYTHVAVLSNAVRGPFLPVYLKAGQEARPWYAWMSLYLDVDDGKLIAPSVMCGTKGKLAVPPESFLMLSTVAVQVTEAVLGSDTPGTTSEIGAVAESEGWEARAALGTAIVGALNDYKSVRSLTVYSEGMDVQQTLKKQKYSPGKCQLNGKVDVSAYPRSVDGVSVLELEAMFVRVPTLEEETTSRRQDSQTHLQTNVLWQRVVLDSDPRSAHLPSRGGVLNQHLLPSDGSFPLTKLWETGVAHEIPHYSVEKNFTYFNFFNRKDDATVPVDEMKASVVLASEKLPTASRRWDIRNAKNKASLLLGDDGYWFQFPHQRPGSVPWLKPDSPPTLVLDEAALEAATSTPELVSLRHQPVVPNKHLVLYTSAAANVHSAANLLFFLDHAVFPEDPHIDYVIIKINTKPKPEQEELNKLVDSALEKAKKHSNVRVYTRDNGGFDFCGWGEAFAHFGGIDVLQKLYRYFIFLNDTVRGPFLPSYAARSPIPWYRLFTSQIDANTRMTGSSASCKEFIQLSPHVQSMAFAVDGVGLWLIRQSFRCGVVLKATVVMFGEMDMALSIKRAGFNFASNLLAYEGVDWRLPASRGCNNRITTFKEYFGGINLHIELMFPKVAGSFRLATNVAKRDRTNEDLIRYVNDATLKAYRAIGKQPPVDEDKGSEE